MTTTTAERIVHGSQVCIFCGKRVEAESTVFVDEIMGCEYDVHSSCVTPEKKREFDAVTAAYFYGDN